MLGMHTKHHCNLSENVEVVSPMNFLTQTNNGPTPNPYKSPSDFIFGSTVKFPF